MNKGLAQISALALADIEHRSVAVAYTNDGETWESGTHNETRYLTSYFIDAVEIWVYDFYAKTPEWVCYMSPKKTVDYVAETGATGELAELLRKIQQITDNSDN